MKINEQVGARLKSIREDLNRVKEEKWTQIRISKEVGFPDQTYLSRLESGKGSIENLIVTLNFYYSQGYNPNWVLIEQNQLLSMYSTSADIMEIGYGNLYADLDDLRKTVDEKLSTIVQKYHS